MAMLDLQAFQSKTYEVKLFDGNIINLKKPSQKLVMDIVALEGNLKESGDANKMLDSFILLILNILNNNAEGAKFDREYVETYFDFEVGMVFIKSYMEFVQDVNSDPN